MMMVAHYKSTYTPGAYEYMYRVNACDYFTYEYFHGVDRITAGHKRGPNTYTRYEFTYSLLLYALRGMGVLEVD